MMGIKQIAMARENQYMKKKRIYVGIFAICMFFGLLLCMGNSVSADAADFKQSHRETKVGKYYVWVDDNTLRISTSAKGNGSVLATAASGRTLCGICLTDGKTVFYVEYAQSDGMENDIGYVYQIKTNKTGKKQIGRLANADQPTAYYKGDLYLDCSDKDDPLWFHTYKLNVKTQKATRVMKGVSVCTQSGQYLYAMSNSGDPIPLPLYVYNCKTGKTTTISKISQHVSISGKKVYYSEYVKQDGSGDNTFRIRSCRRDGKNKKTVVSKLNATFVKKMSAKYIYFYHQGKDYRYTVKTQKKQRL